MTKKFFTTLAGATLFVSLVSVLARGIGFIREIVLATQYGFQETFELYLIAAAIPLTINGILYYIAQNYYIPKFNTYSNYPKLEKKVLIVKDIFYFFILNLFFSFLLLLFTDPILNFYLVDINLSKELALSIFKICLLIIPLTSLSSILIAYLHYTFEFRYSAISQILLNITFIILVYIQNGKEVGILLIPLSLVIGGFVQVIFLIIKCRKLFNNVFKLAIKYRSTFKIEKNFVYIILIESIGQLFILIDRYFFYNIDQGGIAALNYAYIIYTLPINIITFALATVLFSKFSKDLSNNSIKIVEDNLLQIFGLNLLIYLPLTFILFFWGKEIINLVFGYGAFRYKEIEMSFSLLRIFSFSLFVYAYYGILNRVIYSANLLKYLLYLMIFAVFLKYLLNYTFSNHFKQEGLAISTTIVYFIFFFYTLIVIRVKLKISFKMDYLKHTLNYFLNGVFSFLLVYFFSSNINGLLQISLFVLIFYLNLYIINDNYLLFLIKNYLIIRKT